jgi:hypothetical protein
VVGCQLPVRNWQLTTRAVTRGARRAITGNPMTLPTSIIPRKPSVRRKRRSSASFGPPPVAVSLTAVHVQQAGDTLEFVFDSDIVAPGDGGQFACTLDGAPVAGDSIDSFSGASIIVYFGQDVSAATVGTLVSGAGIVFSNGGVAADGQTQPVTMP